MIAIFRAQLDTRPIVQPEPPLLRLFQRYFKPLTSPQPFDTFVIHLRACISQQSDNPTVATLGTFPLEIPCRAAHIDQTGAPALSCPRPSVLRQPVHVAFGVVWIGAGPERDKPVAQKP